jgi:hypothetical protein
VQHVIRHTGAAGGHLRCAHTRQGGGTHAAGWGGEGGRYSRAEAVRSTGGQV